jgi:hypothetical protein
MRGLPGLRGLWHRDRVVGEQHQVSGHPRGEAAAVLLGPGRAGRAGCVGSDPGSPCQQVKHRLEGATGGPRLLRLQLPGGRRPGQDPQLVAGGGRTKSVERDSCEPFSEDGVLAVWFRAPGPADGLDQPGDVEHRDVGA